MLTVEQFVQSLSKWREAANPAITSYSSLVYQLAYDIGCRWDTGSEMKEADDSDYLRMIDERVYHLVSEHAISEELLVKGLTETTSYYLLKPLLEREADIACLEKMLREADEIDAILHKLAQPKNPEFEDSVNQEFNTWREITKTPQLSGWGRQAKASLSP